MKQLIPDLIRTYGSGSFISILLVSFLIFYLLLQLVVYLAPRLYHLLEKYRLSKNHTEQEKTHISQISAKLDRLSTEVESFIHFSNERDDELSEKIDTLFQKQEEIRCQQYENRADSIRESILNFAERLRNNPEGDYSIEKFNQIFELGSKYKKIIAENELTNDVFVHDYEYIEAQYKKRFNTIN